MEEFYIVVCDRLDGLPNLCKAQGNEMFFDIEPAESYRKLMEFTYKVSFSVYRCTAEVVGKTDEVAHSGLI